VNSIKTYTKKEVLTVVAEHAGRDLPTDSKGVLTARALEDGSVEVFFVPDKNQNKLVN
jgi:hypothetical protein